MTLISNRVSSNQMVRYLFIWPHSFLRLTHSFNWLPTSHKIFKLLHPPKRKMQTFIIASQLFSLLTSQRTFFLKTLHNQMDEGSNQIDQIITQRQSIFNGLFYCWLVQVDVEFIRCSQRIFWFSNHTIFSTVRNQIATNQMLSHKIGILLLLLILI